MEHSFIHENAKIGKNVQIGRFSYIDDNVEIGENTIIYPNVTILNGTRIGKNCKIFPGAVIGGEPQDISYNGEDTLAIIGDGVVIREFVTIHRGTIRSGKTVVGDNCYLMAYVHIAHDCRLGESCFFANGVNLGGHVIIGNFVTIGGLVPVHQFVHIGDQVMIGGGSLVRKDVPPYIKAAREPISYVGVNSIGLRRRGFSNKQIEMIRDIYRILYVEHVNVKKAVNIIKETVPESEYKTNVLKFIEESDRGLIRGLQV
ncbi:MAG TPA: acyl-ACP--UDP-N-acetylglucosamine O-acyltransferase [Bacteroidetes bacterium]|nr:acyl-ACP--UDP-N-acetylglucosamine O-acyltransferase [Bacteroidota bacterium]